MEVENTSIEVLRNRLREIKNEIPYLEWEKAQIENEIYYRKYPECRPE